MVEPNRPLDLDGGTGVSGLPSTVAAGTDLRARSSTGSAVPERPGLAPVVSQFCTDFTMTKPDPRGPWDLVERFAAGKPIPVARLFGA